MRLTLVDCFPVLLLVLFAAGVRPVRPLCAYNDAALSLQTGSVLRGLFALVVILHHLSLKISDGTLFHAMRYTGHLAVGVFFFLSGYGVMRAMRTRDAYEVRFLRRRARKLALPYAIVTILYWTFCLLDAHTFSFKASLAALRAHLIVPYTWYIFCISLFYIVFWILMRLCRKKDAWMLLGAVLWCVVYSAVCIRMQSGPWRFKTVLLLAVGMAWAAYEARITAFLRKRYFLLAPCTVLLFGISFYLYMLDVYHPGSKLWTSLPAALFSALFFVLGILMLDFKCRLQNPVLRFLGENSLEIYLVQGLFIEGLRSNLLYVQNDFLWVLLSLFGSVALGCALHAVSKTVFKHIKL